MNDLESIQKVADFTYQQAKQMGIIAIKENEVHLDHFDYLKSFILSSEATIGEYEVYVVGEYTGKLQITSDLYETDIKIAKDTVFMPSAPVEYIAVKFSLKED